MRRRAWNSTPSSCPAGRKACFPTSAPSTRAAAPGLEEERRLAHVGLTRAQRRAKIYFASNRRIHGLWNSTVPSRFVDDLPEAECGDRRGAGEFLAWRRLWRRLALRPDATLHRLVLPDPRLAACPGAPRRDRGRRLFRTPVRRPTRADDDRGRARGQIHRQLGLQRSAGASSTPSSAPAPSRPSTATSSRSSSTRPGGRWCSTASSRRWASLSDSPSSHRPRLWNHLAPVKRSRGRRCFRCLTC